MQGRGLNSFVPKYSPSIGSSEQRNEHPRSKNAHKVLDDLSKYSLLKGCCNRQYCRLAFGKGPVRISARTYIIFRLPRGFSHFSRQMQDQSHSSSHRHSPEMLHSVVKQTTKRKRTNNLIMCSFLATLTATHDEFIFLSYLHKIIVVPNNRLIERKPVR